MTLVGPLLQRYFIDYLIAQRRLSPQTLASYRDTFRLLLQFVHREMKVEPSLLSRCTKLPEYGVRGCFAALKFRNPLSCLHSNPEMKPVHIHIKKDITASLYLYSGQTSASTSSGIYVQ